MSEKFESTEEKWKEIKRIIDNKRIIDKIEKIAIMDKIEKLTSFIIKAQCEWPKDLVGIDVNHPCTFEALIELKNKRNEWFKKYFGDSKQWLMNMCLLGF